MSESESASVPGSLPLPADVPSEPAVPALPDPNGPPSDPGATPAMPVPPPFARLAPIIAPALVPAGVPAPPAVLLKPLSPPPAVQSTRRLIGASFDLLTQSTADMRRASFYIGAVVLATIGPIALGTFAFEVATSDGPPVDLSPSSPSSIWFSLLASVAVLGLVLAEVESRNMAVAILGGRYAGRPIDVRAALARSRMTFWRAIVAAIIVTIPVSIATNVVDGLVTGLLNGSPAASFVVTVVVGVLIGAPLAYLLTGIVLGDVDAFEATRRSFGVFRARKSAAALVATFELLAIFLVLIGVGAGLELVLGAFDAMGLGTDSGPLGIVIIAAGIVIGTFALGTLIYTALAISIAPQVVMFVGLTRATIGLDHVRPGGDHDPRIRRRHEKPFHWVTLGLWLGLGYGLIGLIGMVTSLPD